MSRAKGYDLPKSNHSQRVEISHVSDPALDIIDRRAIPASATESFWTAADGHRVRRIDWPVEGSNRSARGSILFLPGRGDNYEKYLETLEQWHRKGWRVTASDWRGQAGSGRLGGDAVTGHIDDFATWVADLKFLWEQWKTSTPGPHILAAHSMGGHLALRALAEGAVDPDAVVLSAPMLGFVGALPPAIGHTAARMMLAIGNPMRPAWKWSEKPGEIPVGRINLLTHDSDRYQDELWWREKRPEIVMGPGSWGWVERAYDSMRGLFDGDKLEKIETPVLIVATSNDKLVGIRAIDEAARRIPNAELLRFGKEAHHEILREIDAVRDRALETIDEFLERVVPAK
ncbi:Lysophospholipase [Altererythrobacter insulae]|nr:Lysophospholipase [Altererythrobacter insulae]